MELDQIISIQSARFEFFCNSVDRGFQVIWVTMGTKADQLRILQACGDPQMIIRGDAWMISHSSDDYTFHIMGKAIAMADPGRHQHNARWRQRHPSALEDSITDAFANVQELDEVLVAMQTNLPSIRTAARGDCFAMNPKIGALRGLLTVKTIGGDLGAHSHPFFSMFVLSHGKTLKSIFRQWCPD
jgi:hypothetical protein